MVKQTLASNTDGLPAASSAVSSILRLVQAGVSRQATMAAGWIDSLSGSVAAKMGRVVATYAALTALTAATGLVDGGRYTVNGRAATADGGEGDFYYNAASTTAANGGTILAIDGGGAGRFFRYGHGNIFLTEMFGDVTTAFGAAFTAACAAMNLNGGGMLLGRKGTTYSFTDLATCDTNNVTLDFSASRLKPTRSGAKFVLGNGTTQRYNIQWLGGWVVPDTMVTGVLFQVKGVRGIRIDGLSATTIHSFIDFDETGTASSYFAWLTNCEVTFGAGHGDGINIDGLEGELRVTACSIEGMNEVGSRGIVATSDQGTLVGNKCDYVILDGGTIINKFDYGLAGVNGRMVNLNIDNSCRIDNSNEYAIYFLVSGADVSQGLENAILAGMYRGSGKGVLLLDLQTNPNTTANITVDIVTKLNTDDTVKVITTNGAATGQARGIVVKRVHLNGVVPSNTSKRGVSFVGNVEGEIDNVTGFSTGNALDYTVYNDTATARKVRIGRNVFATNATLQVYDPNIGDLSIGRRCEINPDGSPRGRYAIRFAQTDFATSQTNVAMNVYDATGVAVAYARVLRRSRITGLSVDLNANVAAGSLTIGAATGASIDPNLDIVMTTGDGNVVEYVAGSAALAAGDKVYARYTSDGSLTANIDGVATLYIEEM